MHFHWQNLREDARGRPRGFPLHGRAWLNTSGGGGGLRVEWVLGSKSCGAALRLMDDETVSGSVALPPVALYWGLETSTRGVVHRFLRWLVGPTDMSEKYGSREVSLRVFDWSVWWRFWVDPNGWSSKRSLWRDGSLNLLNLLLGRQKYASDELKRVDILVPMPEGTYSGTCKLTEDSWKRPRWPFTKRIRRANVEMREPIPFPGKGENSWDCGEDAIHGWSGPATTVSEAIASVTESALRDRERYGSIDYVPEKLRNAKEEA